MNSEIVNEIMNLLTEDGLITEEQAVNYLLRPRLEQLVKKANEKLRQDRTSVALVNDRTLRIVSGDYGLVAERTASNAYDIKLLDGDQYNEHLKNNKDALVKAYVGDSLFVITDVQEGWNNVRGVFINKDAAVAYCAERDNIPPEEWDQGESMLIIHNQTLKA